MIIKEITKQKTYYEVRTEDGIYEIEGELLRRFHLQEGMDADEEAREEMHR